MHVVNSGVSVRARYACCPRLLNWITFSLARTHISVTFYRIGGARAMDLNLPQPLPTIIPSVSLEEIDGYQDAHLSPKPTLSLAWDVLQ